MVRGVAALVLSLAAVALVAQAVRSVEERGRRARYRTPFSAAGAEAVAPDGSAWRAADLRRPAVVLYVVWSCPHCAAELQRWGAMTAEEMPGPEVDLWIVAPDPPPPGGPLPEVLRGRVLLDREDATARTLGTDVVPTTAYIAPGGSVIARTRGRTSGDRIRRSLLRLREVSNHGAAP